MELYKRTKHVLNNNSFLSLDELKNLEEGNLYFNKKKKKNKLDHETSRMFGCRGYKKGKTTTNEVVVLNSSDSENYLFNRYNLDVFFSKRFILSA